jgi:glucoamylase
VVHEVDWPSTGKPKIRDLGFCPVGDSGWIDLKRVRTYGLSTLKPYLPLPTTLNQGLDYSLLLDVLHDPHRDVLPIRYELSGNCRLVVTLAPHVTATGQDNASWEGDQAVLALHGDRGLDLADDWNERLESLRYVTGTLLAQQPG